ncbi:Transthyretin [Methylobacterium sp. 4-46]|uniref:hydroxyisourate hydrolase n=1 Tax=unclassified Methylobacterium TaxID=2615210 RepID=UPI000152E35E|nr:MULTISPECIES: hydroxyisourate hydrolase [Methylobacterium]ACA18401.1 Transthyretin [Methylobacterium sp. 4-46]WFT77691.1 hydroxyisourate hydrolase [Methylobacterium nodulans]
MRAGGISVHAVDVATGRPAAGLRVTVEALDPAGRRLVAEGRIGPDGHLPHPISGGAGVTAGIYEVTFDVGDYLAPEGGGRFLDRVPFRFTIEDVAAHVHLPLKFTRFGYALFRGA